VNNLERLELVTKIALDLQGRMTYRDIDVYLAGFGIEIPDRWDGPNSKRVYVEHLLASAPPDVVVKIADELEIPHTHAVIPKGVVECAAWKPLHFRLFLSHISEFKDKVAQLQQALLKYGVSAFVAHTDIEPTKEWQQEIEAALQTMDALAAILMPGFKESNWTDQEVGFAVCRGVLIVPVMRGLAPYGFISKYQGFQVGKKTVPQVAKAVFQILVTSGQTRGRVLSALVDLSVGARTAGEALDRLAVLRSLDTIPTAYLERLRDGAGSSEVLLENDECRAALNGLLEEHGLPPAAESGEAGGNLDDIPF
jgi:hypothetical protein